MKEILGELIDGGEWTFADDSELAPEPAAPVANIEQHALIDEPQEPALPQYVVTRDGHTILPRIIGDPEPSRVVKVQPPLHLREAVPRVIGKVVHVQRALGPREQAVLELYQSGAKPEDIATALGMKPGTVTAHLRSLRTLRRV